MSEEIRTPAELAAAQYDAAQLVAVATDCTQQESDALWVACVLELAARCNESAVAQLIAADKVALALLALDLRAHKKKRQVARWQALTAFIQSSCTSTNTDSALLQLTSAAGLQAVLRLAHIDRFGAKDVVAAMAQCVVVLLLQSDVKCVDVLAVTLNDGNDDSDDAFSFLALLKQLYVTQCDVVLRQGIVDALLYVVTHREHSKAAVRAGVLRALLQVALDDMSDSSSSSVVNDGVAVGSGLCDDLMLQCAKVLTHIATFVCYTAPPLPATTSLSVPTSASDVADRTSEQFVCELVVAFMLSGISLVARDGVRMLQMLLETSSSHCLQSQLLAVVDLRGALDKTFALFAHSDRPVDAAVAALAQQQRLVLIPMIDDYERALGASVVGLPPDTDAGSTDPDTVLETAQACKDRGNAFYRRGNYPTARLFYRRAVTLLRAAQFAFNQSQHGLSPTQVLQQCSAGTSVLVQSRSQPNTWRRAMVSDVDDGCVEVIYDDNSDDDDESVEPSRVRPSLPTRVLEAFDALEVDCAMNMGKALAQLHDHASAVESFAHALRVPQTAHAPAALYHRGVAFMALHDLVPAQQDLRRAYDLARTRHDKSLLQQVAAAYKKLQVLHSSKKRADRKLIKQMVRYLSTLPAIQNEHLG